MMMQIIRAMKKAGYTLFTIKPDLKDPDKCIMQVYQDIHRLGTTPYFWLVLDAFDLDGKWGTDTSHQVKTKLPEGTYLTFA
jgi:hypothetical protein